MMQKQLEKMSKLISVSYKSETLSKGKIQEIIQAIKISRTCTLTISKGKIQKSILKSKTKNKQPFGDSRKTKKVVQQLLFIKVIANKKNFERAKVRRSIDKNSIDHRVNLIVTSSLDDLVVGRTNETFRDCSF